MATETRDKDLSVLQIDRSRKEGFEPRKQGPWQALLLASVAIVVVCAVAFFAYRMFANAPVVEVQRVALEPTAASGPVVLTAGGYIVAHHTIEVSSKVVGKVVWVGIEKGDRVRQGQVLVRLDDSEFRAQLDQAKANLAVMQAHLTQLQHGSRPQEIQAALANVEQAQADFSNSGLVLKRTKDLFAQGVGSKQDLDNAQAQYDVNKAKLDNARQNYQLVKIGPRQEEIDYARAQVEQARAALAYQQTQIDSTEIKAPITGTVLDRSIEVGEMVSNMNFGGTAGVKSSVAELADLNDLQVELDINQNDFPKIVPRQDANVTADAYPDRVYKGVVAEISPQADRQKATIQVKVQILHPDAYLRPEMNAHVAFLGPDQGKASAQDMLTIPRTAVVQKDAKNAAFVLDGAHVLLKEIHLGRDLGGRIEVIDGLGPNDRVVVKGAEGLTSGERVKVS